MKPIMYTVNNPQNHQFVDYRSGEFKTHHKHMLVMGFKFVKYKSTIYLREIP